MLGSYSAGESAADQIKNAIGALPGYQAAEAAAEAASAEMSAPEASEASVAEEGAEACPASGMPADGTHANVKKGDPPPAECPASSMNGAGTSHAAGFTAGAEPPAECPASAMNGADATHAAAVTAGAEPPAECPAAGMTSATHSTVPKAGAVPPAECPAHAMFGEQAEASSPDWTEGGEVKVEEAKVRMEDVGKFTGGRAEDLVRGVAEERAKGKNMLAISESFMKRLGSQLGYGHPLAEVTADYTFEWTPEAEAELQDIPDFCREMTKWRVEWTAVKKDLGRVITPEIMKEKYDMWGEVSEAYMDREGKKLEWDPEAWARVENIPSFVLGQVMESVEGNASKWGAETVTSEVLDRVIQKWIDTGDFHEAQFGYK